MWIKGSKAVHEGSAVSPSTGQTRAEGQQNGVDQKCIAAVTKKILLGLKDLDRIWKTGLKWDFNMIRVLNPMNMPSYGQATMHPEL